MDRNFRNDLRKETEDVYKALEAYLRGDSDALQLTGKNGIEGIYRIEHRTLKFMIMQKAVEDPKWREFCEKNRAAFLAKLSRTMSEFSPKM